MKESKGGRRVEERKRERVLLLDLILKLNYMNHLCGSGIEEIMDKSVS